MAFRVLLSRHTDISHIALAWPGTNRWNNAKRIRSSGISVEYDDRAALRELVINQPGAGQQSIWVLVDGLAAGSANTDRYTEKLFDFISKRIRSNERSILPRTTNCAIGIFRPRSPYRFELFESLSGACPCYWAETGRFILASSDAIEVGLFEDVGLQEDERHSAHFFSLRQSPLPRISPFRRISRLNPGEVLFAGSAGTRLESFPSEPRRPGSEDRTNRVRRFGGLLEDSVRQAIGNHDEIAVMLSGGLDSSSCAAIARTRLHRRVRAICWGLPSLPESDESVWIRQLADFLKIDLELFAGEEFLPFSNLDPANSNPNTPVRNAFRELIDQCYRRTAEAGIPVLINGNGGDLIFPLRQWVPLLFFAHREWKRLAGAIAQSFRNNGFRFPIRDRSIRFLLRSILLSGRPLRKPPAPDWHTEESRAWFRVQEHWPEECFHYPVAEFAAELLGHRHGVSLAAEIQHCARYGITRIEPFLSAELKEWMLWQPADTSFRNGETKWVLREYLRQSGLVPREIADKARTGILGQAFHRGFDLHIESIRQLLFEENLDWQRWVIPEFVRQTVNSTEPRVPDRIVVSNAVSHALWKQSLQRIRESSQPRTVISEKVIETA